MKNIPNRPQEILVYPTTNKALAIIRLENCCQHNYNMDQAYYGLRCVRRANQIHGVAETTIQLMNGYHLVKLIIEMANKNIYVQDAANWLNHKFL